MFEVLLWAGIVIAVAGMWYAYDGSRDVFHPLILIAPMMMFVYGWMPLKLQALRGLEGFFQYDQLLFVQSIVVLAVLSFVLGCLSVGAKVPKAQCPKRLPAQSANTLLIGGVGLSAVGLAAWLVSIVNVGGISDAFSKPYSGGWDESGYIRDASLLLFSGITLILASSVGSRIRLIHYVFLGSFITPLLIQAVFTARRGPTFMILVTIGMGWYLRRNRRPPILAMASAVLLGGYLILFIVANRQNLYLGSNFDLTTDVTTFTENVDTGNEYIYGAGSMLSAEQRERFFGGRRYLAQLLVRPIPRAIWPTKYIDFGVPELEHNAGTGEGFADSLGWEGAVGSAPAIVSDLWLEFRWFSLLAMWVIGRAYGLAWRKARQYGGVWNSQYIIMASLSIYLVMQTMEAVIFRLLMLSIPMWLIWIRAERRAVQTRSRFRFGAAPPILVAAE